MLLEYEKRMLLDTKDRSFIIITSFGINISNIINFTISAYLNKFSIAFLINFEDTDLSLFNGNEYFRNVQQLDKSKRNRLFKKCGVFLSTPRLIITDFLENNVDVSRVSCIIVKDAHNIQENGLEAFIFYLYSKKCPDFSIKGFSTNCIPFSYGSNMLDKKSNAFRTTDIILYPRFHEAVKLSFLNDIKFSEHKLKMNKDLIEIQMILIEMLKEVVRPLTAKYGHTYEFILISNQFSIFENLQDTTILYDIKDLKVLINLIQSGSYFLLYYEASKLIQKQINLKSKSTWINCTCAFMLVESLDNLYKKINEFIKLSDESVNIYKLYKGHEKYLKDVIKKQLPVINEDIKTLREEEDYYPSYTTFYNSDRINQDINSDGISALCNKKTTTLVVFINVNTKTTIIVVCNRNIIKKDILFQLDLNCIKYSNVQFYTQSEFIRLSYWTEGSRRYLNSYKAGELNNCINETKNINEIYDASFADEGVKRFKSCFDANDRKDLDLKIVLYDLNLEILRYCEYLGSIKHITVDAFSFKDSLEEEKFLTSTRKEKIYFEQLIEKRSKLPIILDDNYEILEDENSFEENEDYHVVVDSRELRAELVFMLYKSGNKLRISTLKIGDYLLSDDICIERKSIADLISSFNSGRLYTQALHLSHNYSSPFLLLEFIGRPCLSDYCNISSDSFKNSLVSKLTLFIISFPAVKLIWSPSTIYSVKAIRILQKETSTNVEEHTNDSLDPNLLEILLSIPGITQFNLYKIVNRFENLKGIISSSLQFLISILGEVNGTKVFKFFNDDIQKA